MFRRMIMTIFRLFLNHLVSCYTHTHTHIYIYIYIYIHTHTYIYICVCVCVCVCVLLIWGKGGDLVSDRTVVPTVLSDTRCMVGSCCYQAISKFIIDKCMVGIIVCLIVLRNYNKSNVQCAIKCSVCGYNL